MTSRIKFLISLGNLIKTGAVKNIKQAMAFAEQQFGKIDQSFVDDIINVFKKEGKTKEGGVVDIQTRKEYKKSLEEVLGPDDDVFGSPIKDQKMKEFDKIDAKKVVEDRMTADEMDPIGDFYNILSGGKARDPRQGVVRAAAREILNKNKVNIGREDPINVLRKMYGEDGLEAVDAVSDGLLDAQTYGEMNTILKDNKLFDLVPKKTYGYDESIVSAEKIRKAKEQEAKNRQILDEFDIDPDRDPSADGGIIGNLSLNRTGYGLGSVPKGFKLAKKFRESPEYKKFIEMLFIKASNMIRQGKGMFKDLDKLQRIKQHDDLTKEVTNFQKTGELPEGVHQYFGMNPDHAYAKKLIEMEEANVAALEKSREKVKNFKKLQEFDPGDRIPNADGGLIDILKL